MSIALKYKELFCIEPRVSNSFYNKRAVFLFIQHNCFFVVFALHFLFVNCPIYIDTKMALLYSHLICFLIAQTPQA